MAREFHAFRLTLWPWSHETKTTFNARPVVRTWEFTHAGRTASDSTGEEENRKLKQLVAELSLDKQMLQDVSNWSVSFVG